MARRFDEFVRDTEGRKRRGDPRPRTRTGRRGDTRDRTRTRDTNDDTPTSATSSRSEGTIAVPKNPVTGPAKKAGYSGAGVAGTVRDTPTALINDALKALGMGPYGGAGDLLASIASPDQLDTLYALASANKGGFGGSPGDQANFFLNFYNQMLGQGQAPSVRQLMGGAFGNKAGSPDSPFYGMVTGGTPAQQLAQMTSAVADTSTISGMNPLMRRALLSSLNARGREYASDQGKAGANQTFTNFIQTRMPQVAQFLGAGAGGGPGNTGGGGSGGRGGGGGGGGRGGAGRDRGDGRDDLNQRQIDRDARQAMRDDRQDARQDRQGGGGRQDAGGRGGNLFDRYLQNRGGGGRAPDNESPLNRAARDALGGKTIEDYIRQATRQAERGASRDGGGGGGRATANAGGGTVKTGNIDPGTKLTIDVSGGREVARPGSTTSSDGGRSTTAYGGGQDMSRRAPDNHPQNRDGRSPGNPRDFQTYASQNNPYTRPAPRVDVPGFQQATQDWDATSRAILSDRDSAYQQAQAAYDEQVANYNALVQQQQQAAQTRINNPLSYNNPLFKTRVY